MTKRVSPKQQRLYDACIARFRALNNVEVATIEEYEALKIAQAPERAAIHAEIERILAA